MEHFTCSETKQLRSKLVFSPHNNKKKPSFLNVSAICKLLMSYIACLYLYVWGDACEGGGLFMAASDTDRDAERG